MIVPGDEDILRAVTRRCEQDTVFCRQLDLAIVRRDEDEVGRLIQQAAGRVFGVFVDVAFGVIDAVVRQRLEASGVPEQKGE